jgi:hypothetical protein
MKFNYGINQFNTPILSDNPETNYNVVVLYQKIYRFSLRFNTNLSWFNYFQTPNNTETLNNRIRE